jgi:hypothetical protein
MRLSDCIWLAEMRMQQWWGKLVCQLLRQHTQSIHYPEGYCPRCGSYEQPVDSWVPPEWYIDNYARTVAANNNNHITNTKSRGEK